VELKPIGRKGTLKKRSADQEFKKNDAYKSEKGGSRRKGGRQPPIMNSAAQESPNPVLLKEDDRGQPKRERQG